MRSSDKTIFYRIKKLFTNKYLLTGGVFFVYMMLFDTNSFLNIQKIWRHIDELQEEKTYLIHQINLTEEKNYTLEKNPEKIGRMEMNLKNKDEDVFIFVK